MLYRLRTWPRAARVGLLVFAAGCGSTFTSASSEDGGGVEADASAGGGADGSASGDGSTGRDGGGLGGEGGTIEAGGGGGGGVRCGPNKSCLKSESCCVYDDNGSFTYTCHAQGACPTTGVGSVTQLQCANSADCGGTLGHACCIQQMSGGATVASCAGSCSSAQKQAQMCDPSAGVTACIGQSCSSNNINQWGLPDLYGTCGGTGP